MHVETIQTSPLLSGLLCGYFFYVFFNSQTEFLTVDGRPLLDE